ncbi:cell wall protein DAN4-like [Bombus pyrosoma]|uniref:cell wall protein DAN4-like n=1 Tax=Bombus pyrosoma TaxID=396416 RepID=UPI001CB9AE4E|nr:cell wall protein DAN4-like [Bombus pyrosoma]
MRVHEFLIILFTIGLVALQPGEGTLQCYKCDGDSCKEQKLALETCKADSPVTTTTNPPDTTRTNPPDTTTTNPPDTTRTNPPDTTTTNPPDTTTTNPPDTTTTNPPDTTTTNSPDTTTTNPPDTILTGSTISSTSSTNAGASISSKSSNKPQASTSSISSDKPETSTSIKSTTTKNVPTKPKIQSSTTIESTTTEKNLLSAFTNTDRKRRSVIDRFSRIQYDSDNVTYHCYSETVNGVVSKGCTAEKDFCKDKDSCNLCETNECNSATSTVVFTSMIFSLALIVLFVR